MQANYRCAQARERRRFATPTIGSKAGQLHAKLQHGPACRCVVKAFRPRSSGAGYLVEGDSVARGRFVVADGDYSLELAMPDKMVDWDVIREVRGVAAVGHGVQCGSFDGPLSCNRLCRNRHAETGKRAATPCARSGVRGASLPQPPPPPSLSRLSPPRLPLVIAATLGSLSCDSLVRACAPLCAAVRRCARAPRPRHA